MVSVSPDRAKKMLEAIEAGELEKVRLYLKAGVPADYDPGFLQVSASRGRDEAFKELVNAGANINVRNLVGESLLYSSVIGGCLPIIEIVLKTATLSQTDLDVALCTAAHYPRPEVIERLLKAGSNPRFVDENDGTALLIAVCNNNEENALLLFEAGADPSMRVSPAIATSKNLYKKTAADVASFKGMSRLLAKLSATSPRATSDTTKRKKRSYATAVEAFMAMLEWFNLNYPDVIVGPVNPDISIPVEWDYPEVRELFEIFRLIDGSGSLSLIPMPDDVSYGLLSVADAITIAKETAEVAESERMSDSTKSWWSPNWVPFGDNGAGDSLILEFGNGPRKGHVLHFSHETRKVRVRAKSLLRLFSDLATGLVDGKYQFNSKQLRVY